MLAQPLITVIVAVMNNIKGIQRCLDSIANQTYANIELIVMDGGSTDGTVEILFKNNSNITYWESNTDRGLYHAWNKALQHAHGDWLYFPGSDDFIWDNEVIKRFVCYLERVPPSIKIVYGRVCVLAANGEVLKLAGEPWEKAKNELRKYMSIPHQGVMHHRSIFSEFGLFDEEFKISGDYDLFLKALKSSEAYYMADLIVAGMDYGGISTDRSFTKLMLKEAFKARKKHGYKLISWYWLRGYFMASLRDLLVRMLGERKTRQLSILRGRLIGRHSYWEKLP